MENSLDNMPGGKYPQRAGSNEPDDTPIEDVYMGPDPDPDEPDPAILRAETVTPIGMVYYGPMGPGKPQPIEMMSAFQMTVVCPVCGQQNTLSFMSPYVCQNCGADLPGFGAVAEPAEKKNDFPDGHKFCPNCGCKLPPKQKYCNECGMDASDAEVFKPEQI